MRIASDFRVIDLYDPLHPFLLDELQAWISQSCIHLTGIPPLIELHHDGRLLMILPEEDSSEVIEAGLKGFIQQLPLDSN